MRARDFGGVSGIRGPWRWRVVGLQLKGGFRANESGFCVSNREPARE